MARITLRQLLDHAGEFGYGVPAFNINNMEQGLAIMEAARAVDAPVILQASRGARSYAGDIMLGRIIDALEEMYPAIPLCMHQDHGNNVATCLGAIQHGYTSVMMDGSLKEDAKTPSDYDYNVAITSDVARLAHFVGASVEGEIGVLGSLETGEGDAEDGTASRAGSSATCWSPIPKRPRASLPPQRWMRWPSPSAPVTAPTSSPESRAGKSSPWTSSRSCTNSCPTPTW